MRSVISALLLAAVAAAQGPSIPPPIIRITCKPGHDTAPTRPYAAAKAAVDVVGLAADTGLPQTWTIEMHDTFASVEDLDKALAALTPAAMPEGPFADSAGDLLAPPRTLIAIFEPGWSYRASDGMRELPKARYIRVTIHRIRVGLENDFEELVHLRKLTNDSVNLDRPELAYHVISGAQSGTYIVLTPLNSLRAFDEGVPDIPAFAAPAAEARAKAAPKAADMELAREHLLFRIQPNLSYVSDDFAATDRPFWRGTANQ